MSGLEAQAQTLDDLVTQSNKLVEALDKSILVVGGMDEVARQGRIVPRGVAALISDSDVNDYNYAATSYTSTTPGAQEWFNATADAKVVDLNNSVQEFVGAASPLIEATRVSQMAEQVQLSGNIAEQQALEDYVATNDVVVDNTELAAFNASTVAVETSAAVAGAYLAAASDSQIVEFADRAATEFNATYSEVTQELFNRDTNYIEVQFASYNQSLAFDMGAYVASASEILDLGVSSDFYKTGPTQNACFFEGTECDGK